MIDIGTIRGSEVTTNKDGDDNVRLLQVEASNPDDLQTVEQIRGSGEDSNPQPGSRCIVLDIGKSYRVVVGVDDGVEPTVSEGEKELYSYDDTLTKKAQITLSVDGAITINNDNAVISILSDGTINIDNGNGATIVLTGGNVEINGNTDNGVRYSVTKSAYDQLKSDFDNFVTTIFNLHNHPTAPVGPVSPPSLLGAASTGDISGAKIDEVKVS